MSVDSSLDDFTLVSEPSLDSSIAADITTALPAAVILDHGPSTTEWINETLAEHDDRGVTIFSRQKIGPAELTRSLVPQISSIGGPA